jgi:hypothetical protein
MVKAYRPESNSLSSGQVLQSPYDWARARIVIQEMADAAALNLVAKRLTADQVVLTVGYDRESRSDPAIKASYHGEVSTDYYGRVVPKHAHGSANLGRQTSSTRLITEAVVGLFDSIVNKDLKWETSTEYNAGIDFGFFGGRINGSVDVYQKTSKDLLYSVALPLESGGGSMVTNIGSVRNTGVEVALTTVNVETKDWHWETTFTFAANKNKVREINGTGDRVLSSGSSGPTTGSLFVGSSVNNTYAYEWGGVVTDRDMTVPNTAAATNAGLTPGSTMKEYDYYYKVYGLTEGQPYVIDQNGDGNIDQDDRVVKSMDPKWTGSFTSNLTWKNWDFSFSLYAKVGYKVYSSFLTSDILGLNDRGRQKLAMDWYIPAGTLLDCDGVNEDGTYINPKYQEVTHYGGYPFPNNGGSNSGVGRQADYWNVAKGISDASFLKVKNITLGYTFEKNFLNKFGCKHLRLYATVTNPFVITSYKGFDPEWAGAGVKQDGPSTINYQVGASIKF